MREMAERFARAACGGTFDMLHKGHKTLLRKAFQISEKVLIGLTTDEFVKKLRKSHPVAPYEERLKELKEFLKSEGLLERAEIIPLSDPYGPIVWDGLVDAIVVSQETAPRAEEINKIRQKRGLKPLKIIAIDMVLARDRRPISTTRIRAGEIDREGRILHYTPAITPTKRLQRLPSPPQTTQNAHPITPSNS